MRLSALLAMGLMLMAAVICHAQVTFTEYTIPTCTSWPIGITTGPDGNLWFVENNAGANKIGRITPAGGITRVSESDQWQ
jgi:streptogramin lyase